MPIFEVTVRTVVKADSEDEAIKSAKQTLKTNIESGDMSILLVDITEDENYEEICKKYF